MRSGGFGQRKTGDDELVRKPRISEEDFLEAVDQIRQADISDLEHVDKEVIIAAMECAYYLCDKKSEILDRKIVNSVNKNGNIFEGYICHLKTKNPNLNPNSFLIQDRNGREMGAKTLDRHYNAIVESIGYSYALSGRKKIWNDLRQSGACHCYDSILDKGYSCRDACDHTATMLGLGENRAQVRDLLRDNVKGDGRSEILFGLLYYLEELIDDVWYGAWNNYDEATLKANYKKFCDKVKASKDPEVQDKADGLIEAMQKSLEQNNISFDT